MIGVLVRFQFSTDFSEGRIRQIAEGASSKFEGMAGLRSKAFAIDLDDHEAVNFYLWDSEVAARSFFAPELVDRIAALYGVRPTVQFVTVVALVDNARIAASVST